MIFNAHTCDFNYISAHSTVFFSSSLCTKALYLECAAIVALHFSIRQRATFLYVKIFYNEFAGMFATSHTLNIITLKLCAKFSNRMLCAIIQASFFDQVKRIKIVSLWNKFGAQTILSDFIRFGQHMQLSWKKIFQTQAFDFISFLRLVLHLQLVSKLCLFAVFVVVVYFTLFLPHFLRDHLVNSPIIFWKCTCSRVCVCTYSGRICDQKTI